MGLPKSSTRPKKLTELRRKIIRIFLSKTKDSPGKFGDIGSTQWFNSLIGKLKEHNKRTGDVSNYDIMHWLHTSDLAPFYEEVKVSVVRACSSTQDAGATASTSGERINSLQVDNAAAVSEVLIPNGEEAVVDVSQAGASVPTTGSELVPFVPPTCSKSKTVNMSNQDLNSEEAKNRRPEPWRPWTTSSCLNNSAVPSVPTSQSEGITSVQANKQHDEAVPQFAQVILDGSKIIIKMPAGSPASTLYLKAITFTGGHYPTEAEEIVPNAPSSPVMFSNTEVKTTHPVPAEERSKSVGSSKNEPAYMDVVD